MPNVQLSYDVSMLASPEMCGTSFHVHCEEKPPAEEFL